MNDTNVDGVGITRTDRMDAQGSTTYTVRAYRPTDAHAWDTLVERSRNGNFLHRRGYMDYHADRFVDASLLIERNGQLEAVFPANVRDRTAISHGGLTYAGLISAPGLGAESVLAVFGLIAEHYRSRGTERLVYKAVPHIFHAYPAEEDLYALHRLGARLIRRDASSVISMREPLPFADRRKRTIAKAKKAGVRVRKSNDLAAFHALLTDALRKHDVTPVHSLSELTLLQARFPQHIVVYGAYVDDVLLAATLVYDFGHTVHTQYLAASDEGRRMEALSLLLAQLISENYADRRYFSLGISTEQEGCVLNQGLIAYKEFFGARTVVHDFYEWDLR